MDICQLAWLCNMGGGRHLLRLCWYANYWQLLEHHKWRILVICCWVWTFILSIRCLLMVVVVEVVRILMFIGCLVEGRFSIFVACGAWQTVFRHLWWHNFTFWLAFIVTFTASFIIFACDCVVTDAVVEDADATYHYYHIHHYYYLLNYP